MKNVAKSSAIRIVIILWHFWNLYLKVLDPIDLYCGQKILPNFLFCVLQKTKKRNLFETALMRGNNGRIFIFRWTIQLRRLFSMQQGWQTWM